MPASKFDASTVPNQENAFAPTAFLKTLSHVFPPFRVTCTLPSSVPTQITFESSGDGAIEMIVVWNSAAVLSVTMSPPDDCCFAGSFVVKSGEITVHDVP